MKIKVSSIVFWILIMILMIASAALAAQRGNVGLMTKEELKARLGDVDVIVLDVRRGTDWRASEFKIKGAIRMETRDITKANYPKDKTLVLYCA